MQLKQMMEYIIQRLTTAGIEQQEAVSIARLLLSHRLSCSLSELPLRYDVELEKADLKQELARLEQGEPVQYLLGETEFMGLKLECCKEVLIPRGDSEPVVELAIELMRGIDAPMIVDICTGSGAYALALAAYLPTAQLVATDISASALQLAQHNALHLGLAARIKFYQGDLLQPLQGQGSLFDLIVCNPPYIKSSELPSLPLQVQREPQLALDGGPDGLASYRRLAEGAAAFLTPKGLVIIEHGAKQQEEVEQLFIAAGYRVQERVEDYGHRPRGLVIRQSE
jgi:release factor glutamine methyltransferase